MYPKIRVLQWHIWLWVVFTLLHVVCGSAVTNLKIHKFVCVCPRTSACTWFTLFSFFLRTL